MSHDVSNLAADTVQRKQCYVLWPKIVFIYSWSCNLIVYRLKIVIITYAERYNIVIF